jgi:SAM-dependent methyltransferase
MAYPEQQQHHPKIVNFDDPAIADTWRDYHASGMPGLLGSYHLCQALFAFVRTGMLEKVKQHGNAPEVVLVSGLDTHLAKHLLHYLVIRGILEVKDDNYHLTEQGKLLTADIALAQLGFYVEAYGPVTHRMSELLTGQALYATDVLRNGEALGEHCATLFHTYHTSIVLKALEGLNANCILDLGCGGGRFLVDACNQQPTLRGVGLDISPGAIAFANNLCASENLSDRLEFVVGDAFKPESWPAVCHQADVLCAVGVLHEHFRDGEEAVIEILNTYAGLLQNGVKSLILGEPELYYDDQENDADLFLIHIFTMQGFPRRRELWLKLFERTKLRCRRVLTRPTAGPRFNFFDLTLA